MALFLPKRFTLDIVTRHDGLYDFSVLGPEGAVTSGQRATLSEALEAMEWSVDPTTIDWPRVSVNDTKETLYSKIEYEKNHKNRPKAIQFLEQELALLR